MVTLDSIHCTTQPSAHRASVTSDQTPTIDMHEVAQKLENKSRGSTSATGTKRTFRSHQRMSAIRRIVDILRCVLLSADSSQCASKKSDLISRNRAARPGCYDPIGRNGWPRSVSRIEDRYLRLQSHPQSLRKIAHAQSYGLTDRAPSRDRPGGAFEEPLLGADAVPASLEMV